MRFSFRKGSSWFHRLDPGSKFIWLLSVSALGLGFASAAFQAALLAAALLFAFTAARLAPKELWEAMRIPFGFGVPYFVLQLLFLPGEGPAVRVGPLAVPLDTLDFAAAVSLRLLTLALVSFVWIATTDPRDAVLALAQQLRVPYRFAFAVAVALRFLPLLEEEAAAVRAALRVRGAAGGFAVSSDGSAAGRSAGGAFGSAAGRLTDRTADGLPTRPAHLFRTRWTDRLRFALRFAFIVFANAIRRVQAAAETMEARGFGLHPQRTYRRQLTVPRSGRVLAAGSVSAAAALFALL